MAKLDPSRLSVVMPAYNEQGTILAILARVLAQPEVFEVIVVDDRSSDGTRELLQQYRHEKVRTFFHEVNQGKGAALRTGFAQVRGDIVLIQDADLEYDPKDYPQLLQPILDGRADVVYGSRFLGGPHRVLFFWHYVANQFLTLMSNMFTDLNLTDMETCYKVFRVAMLKNIRLRSNRFGFEPEITAKVARQRCHIYELPISYSGRDYSEGKKIGWRDALKALFCIVYFHFWD